MMQITPTTTRPEHRALTVSVLLATVCGAGIAAGLMYGHMVPTLLARFFAILGS